MRIACLALGLAPLLAACGATAGAGDALDTVRMTEDAQIQAIAAHDVRGAVRVYSDDARLVSPDGTSAAGMAAITAEMQKLVADPNLKIDHKSGPGWASGDLAVTTGTATMTTTDAGGKPVTTPFTYQTVWHKADGSPWQIVSDYDVAVPAPVGAK